MKNIYKLIGSFCILFSAGINAQNINRIEYFVNTDPGFGLGTEITGYTPSDNVANLSANINLNGFTNGINALYIRAKDANNYWSLTNYATFIKIASAANITALEYFIDTDPGFGLASSVTITSSQNISDFTFPANLTGVATGTHNLFIRAKDANGYWSLTNVLTFEKTVLGIHVSEKEKLFTVYPNPSSTNFILQYPIAKKIDAIEMIDLSGKTIAVTESNFENGKQIDASQLAKGTYFIKITSEGNVIYKKVIKN